jgi:hypothetical protein
MKSRSLVDFRVLVLVLAAWGCGLETQGSALSVEDAAVPPASGTFDATSPSASEAGFVVDASRPDDGGGTDAKSVDTLDSGNPADSVAPSDAAVSDAAGDAGGLSCKGIADCPSNTVCCGFRASGGNPASTCKAPCNGPNEVQLCDPNAAASGCPAAGANAGACSSATSSDWGLPNGYATCGGRCPGGC